MGFVRYRDETELFDLSGGQPAKVSWNPGFMESLKFSFLLYADF